MNEKDKAMLKDIKNDVLNGRDITKCDTIFLVKAINFLEIENNSLKEKINKIKPFEFIDKICEISKEYGFSISHQDSHGAFIIEKYDEININWLKDAQIDIN